MFCLEINHVSNIGNEFKSKYFWVDLPHELICSIVHGGFWSLALQILNGCVLVSPFVTIFLECVRYMELCEEDLF